MISDPNPLPNYSFPLSFEMQEFLNDIGQFSEQYSAYINENKFSIDLESSEEEITIQNLRLIYYHMRIENDKLKEFIDQIKYFSSNKQFVTNGPIPLHKSPEYPIYQTFNNYTSTIL